MKLFKRTKIVTVWRIDDDTMIHIACGDEKTAREIVEQEFDGEYWRIYPRQERIRA